MEAVDKIEQLWDMSNDEDRQGLVRSLFTEIIYDLDTQRIVNFKLKPWADRFLALRAALYENEASTEGSTALAQAMGNDMLHTGFDISSVYRAIIMVDVEWVVNRLLERLYIHNPQPIHPRSDKTKKLIERNNTIKTRHAAGESVQSLATEYGISEQRIHQILKDRRK